MRVKSKANVQIFSDTEERNVLFAPDDTDAEVIVDDYNEMNGAQFSIAATGNLTLSLGSVGAVSGVFISAQGDFDLVLNGAASAIEVRRSVDAAASDPAKIYLDCVVTSVNVENVHATLPLVGYYAVWGD